MTALDRAVVRNPMKSSLLQSSKSCFFCVVSNAGHEHLVQNVPQRVILQSSSHPLLILQLLVDLIILGVRVLLHPDVEAIVWRQGLLQPHPDGETNDRSQ